MCVLQIKVQISPMDQGKGLVLQKIRMFIVIFTEPVADPYSKPDESSAHPHTLFLQNTVYYC